MNRRAFLATLALAAPALALGDAVVLEPRWLRVRRRRLSKNPVARLVHITDLHHHGDRAYARRIVATVNGLDADFVCFTGDFAESLPYLDEALDLLSAIRRPVYAVPGNHEYWMGAPDDRLAAFCTATGGAWLKDSTVTAAGGRCLLAGDSGQPIELGRVLPGRPAPPSPGLVWPTAGHAARRILLTHFPLTVEDGGERVDLVLAGHSHGGQVRLPLLGALIVPYGVGPYDSGWYDTPRGPLHVSQGLGAYRLPVRFCCRPEITVIEL